LQFCAIVDVGFRSSTQPTWLPGFSALLNGRKGPDGNMACASTDGGFSDRPVNNNISQRNNSLCEVLFWQFQNLLHHENYLQVNIHGLRLYHLNAEET
jgi:hypothetical protein